MRRSIPIPFFLSRGRSNYSALLSVSSLLGVVLIARPEFLFGRHQEGGEGGGVDGSDTRIVTPTQRLAAVGYVYR